ncbi:MAG: hypothetical protein IJI56_03245 [Firmicutes bacterium]|nr:hypothetical protein [Bacillota bacterium]
MMKRVSVILMTMIMTVTMIPASVFADEAETASEALVSENLITSVQEEVEEAVEVVETVEIAEEVKEPEVAPWKSYTLYNYISLNEGRTYISLNTQEGGITTPMSAEEFQKAHGNKRYDLNTSEYQIAGYDLSSLVITNGGMRFVERSVAKEGQAYFIARLDRVEAVRAANFRYSADIAPLTTAFNSLGSDHITFHRNWYVTLVTPMAANQKLLTGIQMPNGKYYGIAYTDSFKAIDSRMIPFSKKLSKDQYEIADYDFTNLVLDYEGNTYAYRPDGPVAGDGKDFHYYTVSFQKLDKLNKSTYGGGYLAEGWPSWPLVNTNAADPNGFPYMAGYYHRDYTVTLHVEDGPVIEEPVEEIIEETEEPIEEVKEEVIEEEIVKETKEETTEELANQPEVIEALKEEEPEVIEEIKAEAPKTEASVAEVEEEAAVEEIIPEAKDEIIEETTETIEETAEEVLEEAVQEATEETVEEVTEEVKEKETLEAKAEETAATAAQEAPATAVVTYSNAAAVETVSQPAEILVASAADEAKEELVEIAAEEVPLAEMPEGTLAIVNLISAIGTVFLSLVMLFTGRNRRGISAASILPAAGAVAAIILTQDMSGAMAMTDKWTAVMIAIAAVNVVLLMIRGGRKETAKTER